MKEGWKMVKFSEIAQVVGGSTPKTNIKSFWDGDNYWVTPAELKGEKYINKTERTITNEAVSKTNLTLLPKGTVLLSSRAPIGKVCITKVPMYCNQGFKNIVCKDSLYNEFVYYYLLYSVPYLESLGTGATFKEISKRVVENVEIPLPPLEEQHRIVGILDAAFAKIDALKKNAEENLTNAKALFQQVLAQELQPKEGWVEKKLTDISENLDYKRVPITKNVRKSGKFPYYGASGIVDYVNDYLYDEDLLLISEDGANLLARTTPIAFSVSGKIWVNNHAHVLRFNNLTLQKFVEYFIAGFNITPYVTGMAQPKLNQKALEKIIISFPTDIEEQHRIVRTLDTLSEKCRRLEEVAQQTIRECEALKQSILRQAFSGEL